MVLQGVPTKIQSMSMICLEFHLDQLSAENRELKVMGSRIRAYHSAHSVHVFVHARYTKFDGASCLLNISMADAT